MLIGIIKNDANELIYKIARLTHLEKESMVPRVGAWWRGIDWEFGGRALRAASVVAWRRFPGNILGWAGSSSCDSLKMKQLL